MPCYVCSRRCAGEAARVSICWRCLCSERHTLTLYLTPIKNTTPATFISSIKAVTGGSQSTKPLQIYSAAQLISVCGEMQHIQTAGCLAGVVRRVIKGINHHPCVFKYHLNPKRAM